MVRLMFSLKEGKKETAYASALSRRGRQFDMMTETVKGHATAEKTRERRIRFRLDQLPIGKRERGRGRDKAKVFVLVNFEDRVLEEAGFPRAEKL